MKRLGLSWTGCAPSCYVKFDVTSKVRDQFGLSDLKRVSPSAAPLRVPKAYPHPIQHYPIQTLCVRSEPVFLIPACVCIRVGVSRCTLVLFAESPRSARPLRLHANNS